MSGKRIYEDMRSISITQKSIGSAVSLKSKGDVYSDCREVEALFG